MPRFSVLLHSTGILRTLYVTVPLLRNISCLLYCTLSTSFLPRKSSDWPFSPPSLLFNGYGGEGVFSPEVMRPERKAHHPPSPNTKKEYDCKYTSSPLYAFTERTAQLHSSASPVLISFHSKVTSPSTLRRQHNHWEWWAPSGSLCIPTLVTFRAAPPPPRMSVCSSAQ